MSKRKHARASSSQIDLEEENRELRNEVQSLRAELAKRDAPVAPEPSIAKMFVLKHVFENVTDMENNDVQVSIFEDHFGLRWRMSVRKTAGHVSIHLWCQNPANSDVVTWSVETEFIMSLKAARTFDHTKSFLYTFRKNEDHDPFHGSYEFLTWEEMERDCLTRDGKLMAEVQVSIKRTKGLYPKNLRCFDASTSDLSDVILVVNGEKFHVSKLTLATQSTYFKIIFFGAFKEAAKKEIDLPGLAESDFQKYLEVVYGHECIDDATVEGVLLIADMYDTEIVREKCEKFLIDHSAKSSKKKLELSTRYGLEALKNKCFARIETVREIESLIPNDILDMDHSTMGAILQKSIAMLKARPTSHQ